MLIKEANDFDEINNFFMNNAYAHARAPTPPSPCAHVISFFGNARNGQSSRSVVLRSLNYRRTRVAQPTKGVETRGPGSSSRPKGLTPTSADPDHTHVTTLASGTASRHPQMTAGHLQTTCLKHLREGAGLCIHHKRTHETPSRRDTLVYSPQTHA